MKSNALITVDADILGTTPVIKGTRVPVKRRFEYLAGHEGWTGRQQRWGGIKTFDHNIRYQQNLAGRQIATLELATNDHRRNRAAEMTQTAVATIPPREFRGLEIPKPPR